MTKHHLYGIWHRVRRPSLLVLVGLVLLSGFVSLLALRANNLRMIQLRQAVYVIDEQDGDVEAALKQLREHVYAHMNTNLRQGSTTSEPPLQLVGQFNRAVAAEQARIAAQGGSNKVYVDAQRECENPNVPLTIRANCVQEYIVAHGSSVPQLNLPPKELYTFDFASPAWSPDLAGWSLVLTGIFATLLVGRLVLGRYMKAYLA